MNAIDEMTARLPLLIDNVSWQDPVLIIGSGDWWLRVMTAWRISFSGKYLFSSDDEPIEESLVDLLKGKRIVACGIQGSAAPFDPAITICSGHVLEIFSVSALEPWVLNIKGLGSFVSSPSG